MICVVKDCGNEVHPERLAAIPLAKTCSSACSDEHASASYGGQTTHGDGNATRRRKQNEQTDLHIRGPDRRRGCP